MTITGIAGSIGTGKSLKQLAYALEQCDKKKKKLVTNFAINLRELRKYAGIMRYHWVAWLVDTGQIATIDALENIEQLLVYKESVCCLDEAGIFLNSRDFAKTPKSLLMNLCQSRKDGIDVIWAAQFDSQVDAQFRQLTQYWIHCSGGSVYDRALRRPRLVWKNYYYFDSDAYNLWLSDKKARSSYFKTRFQYAFKCEGGLLDKADKQLFKCFDSFSRLEKQKSYSCSFLNREFCFLPGDYYFNRLPDYDPSLDPLRGSYKPINLKFKPTLIDILKMT